MSIQNDKIGHVVGGFMDIIASILFLIPSLIGIKVDKKLNKRNTDNKKIFVRYIIYVLLNYVCSLFTLYILIGKDASFDYNLYNISFNIKYLMMSIFYACLIPSIEFLYKKYIKYEKKIISYKNLKLYKKILGSVLIFIDILLFISAIWGTKRFDNINLDEIIFHLLVPMEGTNIDYFVVYLYEALIPIFIISIIVIYLYTKNYNKTINLKVIIKNKIKINLSFLFRRWFYLIFITLVSFGYITIRYNLYDFLKNQLVFSNFIEKNYVDPNSVKITFPEKKKNLIYIYLESMESSFTDTSNGGIEVDNLIPNLTKLAYNNTFFSPNGKLGGAYFTYGGSWTIGSMVSQSAGIPLKVSVGENAYADYQNFLPGVTTLGDILNKNGYNQMIMFGSDAGFAGRDTFYKSHGNYEIYDYYRALEDEKMTKDDFVWWGFEDKDLYKYAKEQLSILSKKDEPFNFTMLTVDTHAQGGYLSSICKKKFGSRYNNVIYCADSQINSFINWLKKQDFYKNTTIVIVGDHLTMDNSYIDSVENITDRMSYNVFINSSVKPINTNREYILYDMFPTILASMGVKIEGDKLGLGTNLFSEEQNLIEKYGYDYINDELAKRSSFYTKNFVIDNK